MPVNLFPAQTEVFARLKAGKVGYHVRVQAWDDQGNPWVIGVPDLGHDLTKLLQANLLPEFRKLKPSSDADPTETVAPVAEPVAPVVE